MCDWALQSLAQPSVTLHLHRLRNQETNTKGQKYPQQLILNASGWKKFKLPLKTGWNMMMKLME